MTYEVVTRYELEPRAIEVTVRVREPSSNDLSPEQIALSIQRGMEVARRRPEKAE